MKFAGRMIIQNYMPVAVDRLGSVVANPTQGSTAPKYYGPYGEQYNEAQPRVGFPRNTNFATYFHDETTGLNYADRRFYNSQYGRFMSADPSHQDLGLAYPSSFNKYSYASSDPINVYDPSGPGCTLADNGSAVFFLNCTEFGGRGGGGGGPNPGGHIAPNDPPKLTQAQLRRLGADLQQQVAKGLRDCEALAQFFDAAGISATKQQLFQDAGNLVPSSIETFVIPHNLKPISFVGKTSGYLPIFQNTPGDNTDQTHHFAAFFEFGYRFGAKAAASIGSLREQLEAIYDPLGLNEGDIELAVAAGNLGAYLSMGILPPDEVGQAIRENICK